MKNCIRQLDLFGRGDHWWLRTFRGLGFVGLRSYRLVSSQASFDSCVDLRGQDNPNRWRGLGGNGFQVLPWLRTAEGLSYGVMA